MVTHTKTKAKAKTPTKTRKGNIAQRNWTWLLALGVLFVILGSIGLGMVAALTLASMVFLGILLLIGGVSQIIDTFKSRQWRGVLWHSLIALFYVIAGILVIYDPILASTLITAVLAGLLIIIGISRLMLAFLIRDSSGWGWLLVAGIAALVLGIMILMQWPMSGLWIIGLFIAIEMIINGWATIFWALSLRKA